MKKANFYLIVFAAIVLALAATDVAFASPRQLKLASFIASGSPWHKAMLKFGEIVKERTQGAIEVISYPDGQLGNVPQNLTGMQMGTIDMAYFDVVASSYLKPLKFLQIVFVPYLFNSKEEAARKMNSKIIMEMIDAAAKESGVRIFNISGNRSPRALQTTKGPIWVPEQVKGFKLRTPGLPICVDTAKALGMKPTVIPMTEIYMALKQGMVDGQENGIDAAIPPKFHEVAKYWSAIDHVFSVTAWHIAEKVWTSLTANEKKIFYEAAEEAGKLATDEVEKMDREAIEILRKSGVVYVAPPLEPWRQLARDVYKPFEGKVWPTGLVGKLRAMP